MPYFRKRPVVIEARLFDGTPECAESIARWIDETKKFPTFVRWTAQPQECWMEIQTLESKDEDHLHVAQRGDWIIRGVAGEFYPCKPDVFAATYDHAEAPDA